LGKDEVAGATAWRLRVQGKSAHSSTPHLGVSAVERLFTILRRWESRGVTFQVLKLEGGTAHNQVPAVAEAILRARGLASPGRGATLVPAASPRDASAIPWRPLADGWERFRDEWPGGFSSNLGVLEPHRSGVRAWVGLRTPAQADHRRIRPRAEALLTSAGGRVSLAIDDPALNAPRRGATLPCLRDALREAAIPFRWAEKPTCTEAGLFHAAGIPAYVWGPGRSVGNIHRPNESIEVDDLSRAVLFYERLFRSWTAS
jgi:acetylornithine deacetylase/succinyl-diaminopimelate desuccinylase-like protein